MTQLVTWGLGPPFNRTGILSWNVVIRDVKHLKKKECTVIIKKSVLVHLNLWRDGVPGTPTAFARAPRARREGIPLIISTENALCNETVWLETKSEGRWWRLQCTHEKQIRSFEEVSGNSWRGQVQVPHYGLTLCKWDADQRLIAVIVELECKSWSRAR